MRKVFSPSEVNSLTASIKDLLRTGAVVRCKPCRGQYLSFYFSADKFNGKKRFILNLKKLNQFVIALYFRLEDHRTVQHLLFKGAFMKDAYFLLSVYPDDRRYLRFQFMKSFFEFTCLPFGLSSAPFDFTKLLKLVVTLLKKENIPCVNTWTIF